MNKQEMFNIVWEHAKKKQKSVKSGSCAYRGRDNAKCFIGACIKDEDYDPSFDDANASTGFEDICSDYPSMREYFKDIPIEFGTELQVIHDDSDTDLWEGLLKEFAVKHNLTIPA